MRIRFQQVVDLQQVTASQVLLLLLPTAKPCFARTRAHQGQSVPTSVLLQFNLGGAHTAESAQVHVRNQFSSGQRYTKLDRWPDAKGGPGTQGPVEFLPPPSTPLLACSTSLVSNTLFPAARRHRARQAGRHAGDKPTTSAARVAWFWLCRCRGPRAARRPSSSRPLGGYGPGPSLLVTMEERPRTPAPQPDVAAPPLPILLQLLQRPLLMALALMANFLS
jgi:hypothetical protein